MAEKPQTPAYPEKTYEGQLFVRGLTREALGKNLPEFVGWGWDWAAGLLNAGGNMLRGDFVRPDYFANGPNDQNAQGPLREAGLEYIGDPLMKTMGMNNLMAKARPGSTGKFGTDVSADGGKTWRGITGSEATAMAPGAILDPTNLIPAAAAVRIGGKAIRGAHTLTAVDKALGHAGLAIMGAQVGHDFFLRGMVLQPDDTADFLNIMADPQKLNGGTNAITNFFGGGSHQRNMQRSMNMMLSEFHDPGNARIAREHKGADVTEYFPSIRIGEKINVTHLKNNFAAAAVEASKINESIEQKRDRTQNNVNRRDRNLTATDHKFLASQARLDNAFWNIAEKVNNGQKLSEGEMLSAYMKLQMAHAGKIDDILNKGLNNNTVSAVVKDYLRDQHTYAYQGSAEAAEDARQPDAPRSPIARMIKGEQRRSAHNISLNEDQAAAKRSYSDCLESNARAQARSFPTQQCRVPDIDERRIKPARTPHDEGFLDKAWNAVAHTAHEAKDWAASMIPSIFGGGSSPSHGPKPGRH